MLKINIHKFISLVALCFIFYFSHIRPLSLPLKNFLFSSFVRPSLISLWSVLHLIQARSIIKLNSIEFISMIWSMFLLDITRGCLLLLFSKELLIQLGISYIFLLLQWPKAHINMRIEKYSTTNLDAYRFFFPLLRLCVSEVRSVEIKITSLALSTYNLYPRINSPNKHVYSHQGLILNLIYFKIIIISQPSTRR